MAADGSILLPTLDDIGHEQTFEGYQDHVVRRDFRALRRVLRDNGVIVVVVDDVIANPGSIYRQQTYHHARDQQKLSRQISFRTQGTTTMRPKGDWLGLPSCFAKAMMDDGWVWRDQVIARAAFPGELVRRALLLTAPPSDLLPVPTVIDIYGGSGTVSVVVKQLGLKSIYIDPNPISSAKAQQCVLVADRDPDVAKLDSDVANDNQPTEEHDTDMRDT